MNKENSLSQRWADELYDAAAAYLLILKYGASVLHFRRIEVLRENQCLDIVKFGKGWALEIDTRHKRSEGGMCLIPLPKYHGKLKPDIDDAIMSIPRRSRA